MNTGNFILHAGVEIIEERRCGLEVHHVVMADGYVAGDETNPRQQ